MTVFLGYHEKDDTVDDPTKYDAKAQIGNYAKFDVKLVATISGYGTNISLSRRKPG